MSSAIDNVFVEIINSVTQPIMQVVKETNVLIAPVTEPVIEVLSNSAVKSVVALLFILYGTLVGPTLPSEWLFLFDNIFFRIIFLSLIVWTGNKDPLLSIAIATTFIVLMNIANKKGLFEKFEGPETSVYPGCINLKVADLLESFDNNQDDLLNAMLLSRIPGDVKLNDYYAPIIGTYLMGYGYKIKAPCAPPTVDQNVGSWGTAV